MSASFNSPRCQIQPRMMGIAKSERKNTAWPAGTSWVAALIMAAITMNKNTALILSAMAVVGLFWVAGAFI